jgi:hypothetical protein
MMAAHPSVNNVRIIGDAVEGCTLKGVGDYLGGREGPSKFEWLREKKDTGLVYTYFVLLNFTLCCGFLACMLTE